MPRHPHRASSRNPGPTDYSQPPIAPSSEYVSTSTSDDPIADLLGATHNSAFLGDPGDNIPQDIVTVFEQFGLGDKAYTCVLKALPPGMTASTPNLPYVKSWTNTIPSVEWVAKNYGPGSYILAFRWRDQAETQVTGKTHNRAEISFEISDKFMPEYQKYQYEQRIENARKYQTKMRDLKTDQQLDRALFPDLPETDSKKTESVSDYVAEIAKMADLLGFRRDEQRASFDWPSVLPALAPLVGGFITMLQDSRNTQMQQMNTLMTLLLTQSKESSQQIVEMAKNHQQPQGASDMMKEVFSMVTQGLDLKEAIQSHGKESPVDRIMGLIESIAPMIAPVMLAAQRQHKDSLPAPVAGMAKAYMANDPDFQQMMQNPGVSEEVIRRMDSIYGWEQTDMILNSVGITRPDTCPRVSSERLPMDQRETQEQEGTS